MSDDMRFLRSFTRLAEIWILEIGRQKTNILLRQCGLRECRHLSFSGSDPRRVVRDIRVLRKWKARSVRAETSNAVLHVQCITTLLIRSTGRAQSMRRNCLG